MIFDTCSGLYLFSSLIDGRFADRINKYINIINNPENDIIKLFLNILYDSKDINFLERTEKNLICLFIS